MAIVRLCFWETMLTKAFSFKSLLDFTGSSNIICLKSQAGELERKGVWTSSEEENRATQYRSSPVVELD